MPSSPASAPRAAVVPLHAPAATPGVSASASAEADSDDEFLQDLWRTPARSSKVPHDDGADWLADLLTTPPPEQARPASPPRGSGELASEEELHMLFSASVAECKGLPVEHWNFDEGKVHHPLHDLVDGAAFYIGATVNPRRRFLGGQSRGGSMPGHCLSWDRLTVLHLANGIGARRVETNLISYCKGRYGHLCTNTAMDSRGVSAQEPAFVYVCTGRRQTPGPPRLAEGNARAGGGRRLLAKGGMAAETVGRSVWGGGGGGGHRWRRRSRCSNSGRDSLQKHSGHSGGQATGTP